MCISILVYETVADVRCRLFIYFNKERRCPVYFNKELWCSGIVLVVRGLHLGVLVLEILLEIEWQIGDFREDGNARVTEDSSQYGRSFTRSL